MVAMPELRFDELPGWAFEVREVSAGHYVVGGQSQSGASVQLEGEDPDELLARCREYAQEVIH
jgi:hypothetical protein